MKQKLRPTLSMAHKPGLSFQDKQLTTHLRSGNRKRAARLNKQTNKNLQTKKKLKRPKSLTKNPTVHSMSCSHTLSPMDMTALPHCLKLTQCAAITSELLERWSQPHAYSAPKWYQVKPRSDLAHHNRMTSISLPCNGKPESITEQEITDYRSQTMQVSTALAFSHLLTTPHP